MRPSLSLAVAAAGWLGVSSPGDYAAFKFPPTSRHDPFSLSLDLAASAEPPGPRAVIEAQITAFQADDLVTAFDHTSDGIRRIFGTPERFGQMVRQGYPMVYRPADLRFLSTDRRDGRRYERVLIADQAQGLHVLEYEMVDTGAGWRINGVRILPAGGAGA